MSRDGTVMAGLRETRRCRTRGTVALTIGLPKRAEGIQKMAGLPRIKLRADSISQYTLTLWGNAKAMPGA